MATSRRRRADILSTHTKAVTKAQTAAAAVITISRMVIAGRATESRRAGRAAEVTGSRAPSPYRAAAARPAEVASHLLNFAKTGLGAEARTG
jgi:hypothetical protein